MLRALKGPFASELKLTHFMKQTKYNNRYGDDIVFTELSKTEIVMSGFEHYRWGDDFIDPSGGPFIKVGIDIGVYFNDKKERKVKAIDVKEGKIILVV